MNAQPNVAELKATKKGCFAGITFNTPNIKEGLAFWEQLDFKAVKTEGDDRAYVSDGSLLIQLIRSEEKIYELTYYCDDPEGLADDFRTKGISVEDNIINTPTCNIKITDKVAGVTEPTGMTMMDMEPSDFMDDSKFPNKKCGAYGEWAIPVNYLDERIAWWKKLGYIATVDTRGPHAYAIVIDGHLIVGLHKTEEFSEATLTFFAPDMEPRIKQLRADGMKNIQTVMGDSDKNVMITAPGGQNIFLFSMGM